MKNGNLSENNMICIKIDKYGRYIKNDINHVLNEIIY